MIAMKRKYILILVLPLLGCGLIFSELLDDFKKLGRLKQIYAGKEYEFYAKFKDVNIGWRVIIDPFHPEKRKYLDEADFQAWKKLGVNTTFDMKLTNRSTRSVNVSEHFPPYTTVVLGPGESIDYIKVKFTDQINVCNVRATEFVEKEITNIDIRLIFKDDISWKKGIYIGLYWADVI